MPLPVFASAMRSVSYASLPITATGWTVTVSLVWMSSAVNISFSFRVFVLLDGLMIRQAPYEIKFGVSRIKLTDWSHDGIIALSLFGTCCDADIVDDGHWRQ